MKKILQLSLIGFILFGFSSCKDDSDVGPEPDPIGGSPVPELFLNANLNTPQLLEVLNESTGSILQPRDLEFHPITGALWVMNKGNQGSDFVIITNPGKDGQSIMKRRDSHSGHFVVNGTALAFSNINTFGTSPEIKNTTGNPNSTFMGPSLWSGDLDVFANVYQSNWAQGQPLGSHYDMLHQSPFSMGIAHDDKNAFWVFDGYNENLVHYDFVDDHGPGADYHGDGIIIRYSDVELIRVVDIPSHMVQDQSNGKLYICDTDKGRVLEVDKSTASFSKRLVSTNEPLARYEEHLGATVKVVIEGLDKPCGIALKENRLFVSDYETGMLYVVNSSTHEEIAEFNTGKKGNTGLEISNDGELWITNYLENTLSKVVRK